MGDISDLLEEGSWDDYDDDGFQDYYIGPTWPRCSCGKVIPPGRTKCGMCIVMDSVEPEQVEIKIKVGKTCDLCRYNKAMDDDEWNTFHFCLLLRQTINNLKEPMCQRQLCSCGKPGNLCMDPYEQEINERNVEVVLCDECFKQHCEDI
jgi:hypothetical protein